jgi:hypothetical protein
MLITIGITKMENKKRNKTWLIILVLAIGCLAWVYLGGDVPNWVPDWLRFNLPTSDADTLEYSLAGGFPAAANVKALKRLASLTQGENLEAIAELKFNGLVWETTEGQKVRILNKRRLSRIIEVQDVGTYNSYWTYDDALHIVNKPRSIPQY